jgi:hypothetical protein
MTALIHRHNRLSRRSLQLNPMTDCEPGNPALLPVVLSTATQSVSRPGDHDDDDGGMQRKQSYQKRREKSVN